MMSSNLELNEHLSQPMLNKPNIIKGHGKRQYFAAFVVSLGGFASGTVLAWTSPALEYLVENKSEKNETKQEIDLPGFNISSTKKAIGTVLTWTSPAVEYLVKNDSQRNETKEELDLPGFKISTTEEAIVGSILLLGALVSAIPSGRCADLIGRKPVLFVSALMFFINFTITGFAKNVAMLLLARFFAGMGLGAACVVSPMYIGEIADESVRGILGSVFNSLLGLGILYTTLVGAFTEWIGFTVALGLVPLVFGIILIFLPESPIYLIAEKKIEKARRSLIYFKSDEASAGEELLQLQKNSLGHEKTGNIRKLFTKKCYRLSLIAGVGIFAYQQSCGINVVVFYTVPIFRAAGSSVNHTLAALTTNLVTVIVGVFSIFLVEKRDRKFFLTLSAFSMMVGLTGLGVFFQLKTYEINFIGLQLLPLISIILFMAGFAIGLGPVPWILITELYAPEIRGVASGVVVVINWFCAFIVTLTYPILMHYIKSSLTFYLYGLINFFGLLFIYYIVPETKKPHPDRYQI